MGADGVGEKEGLQLQKEQLCESPVDKADSRYLAW
jgi:hypothetical protein